MKRFFSIIQKTWHLAAQSPRLRRSLLIGGALFVLINVLTYLLYSNRTYPTTSLAGQRLGSVSNDKLPAKIEALQPLPKEVRFVEGAQASRVKTSDLRVTIDTQQQVKLLLDRRSWLPVANFFLEHNVPLAAVISQPEQTKQAIQAALAGFQREASDAKIIKQDGTFAIQADKPSQIVDIAATQQALLSSLQNGQTAIDVIARTTPAKVAAGSLRGELKKLQAKPQLDISLRYDSKTKKFSAADITSWYEPSGTSMALSGGAVESAIIGAGQAFGIRVANLRAASQAIAAGLADNKAINFELEALPVGKHLTYCTATRGVDASEIAALEAKLASTFSDSRGWGLGGLVQFNKAASGCDFTVWLAAADQMPSFGAICDPSWSCAVSPNVIINFDRWRYASDAWNSRGGSLEDYRSMVINHETGHWFGFDHSFCPGSGQPAPVMQQQSIDLQGCVFNPWPTAGEQQSLKQRLGL